MENVIIEVGAQIVTTAVVTLIGVFGAWLTAKIGKKKELETINEAQQELIRNAQLTVEELMQTVVADLKAEREGGKLTQPEVEQLRNKLVLKTKAKMSKPAMQLLNAAAVDVNAMIRGAGEAWINTLKSMQ